MSFLTRTKRKTIGLINPVFWYGSYLKAFQGLIDEAKLYDVNLLLFQGIYSDEAFTDVTDFSINNTGSIIFDLVEKELLHGIVLLPGNLRTSKMKSLFIEQCKKYHPLPIISVGSKIENFPNIIVDNRIGIQEIINHLVIVHKYKKIAFLCGPADSYDAMSRLESYKLSMVDHFGSCNPDMISSSGPWTSTWGATGTRELLRINNRDIDAIVCASDLLALGALEETKQQGISVPDQIALMGFNDNFYANATTPPLTTVDINIYNRCKKAIELIADSFNSGRLPDEVTVASIPVIRQSCGCKTIGVNQYIEACHKSENKLSNKSSTDVKNVSGSLFNTISVIFNNQLTSNQHNCINEYINSIFHLTDIQTSQQFLNRLYVTLHNFSPQKDDLLKWHQVINETLDLIRTECSSNLYNKANPVLIQSRILIGEVIEQKHKVLMMKIREQNTIISSLKYDLNTTQSREDIIEILASQLPGIGITACYLSIYEDINNPLGNAKCLLAFNSNGRINIPSDGITFPSRKIIPVNVELDDELSLNIIEPLFYGTHHLGFILLRAEILPRSFYELFASQLSAALWNAFLLRKEVQGKATLKSRTIQLEVTNTELKESTSQLENAYNELEKNQQKLLLSEKMASLGRFTEGITSELNDPLRELLSTVTQIRSSGVNYIQLLSENSMDSKKHFDIAEHLLSYAMKAEQAAEKAASFVHSIKEQTRDMQNTESQAFNLISIIESVLIFLGHAVRLQKCTVKYVTKFDNIEMHGQPDKMIQVFTNILSNAIDAVKNDGSGIITIHLDKNDSDNSVIAIVEDNGTGIEKENLSKIFDPMFTTKPVGQGTGLGLPIVHDIVYGAFKGSINVESTVGVGTRFIMQFRSQSS